MRTLEHCFRHGAMARRRALAAALLLMATAERLGAQIATDGSMGAAMNLAGPKFEIPEALGTRAGGNLFHSFATFNLSQGETAAFQGDPGIQNILARVTGGAPSSIDGTLASEIPGANLFFMNPAGVVFGPNAKLELSGNLSVTTAHEVQAGGGGKFAADTAAPVNLFVGHPTGFGFLNANAGNISLNGAKLTLSNRKVIEVASGGISMTDQADLETAEGTVKLAAVKSGGTLERGAWETRQFSLLGDISLKRASRVTVSGSDAGDILVRANDLSLSESLERTTSLRSQILGQSDGGGIDVDLRGGLTMNNGFIVGGSDDNGKGQGSSVSVKAETIDLVDSRILSSAFSKESNAGDISLNAKVVALEKKNIQTGVFAEGRGTTASKGGGIQIVGRKSISLKQETQVKSTSVTEQKSGEIKLSGDVIHIDGASVHANNEGNGGGGAVILTGGTLKTKGSTEVLTDSGRNSQPNGRSGSIIATFQESVEILDDSLLRTRSQNPSGAGDITIVGRDIRLKGSLNANARTRTIPLGGNAGNISLNATGVLEIHQSGDALAIQSLVYKGNGSGAAGTIKLDAQNLNILNGSVVRTGNFDSDRTGSIIVNVRDRLAMDGGGNERLTTLDSFGASFGLGRIDVKASSLEVRRGALLGNMGQAIQGFGSAFVVPINVAIAGEILIDGGETANLQRLLTGIISDSNGPNPSAPINIRAGSLVLVNAGQISSSAYGTGAGGDIDIVVHGSATLGGGPTARRFSPANISAISSDGNAGNITIIANSMTMQKFSRIANESTGVGVGGQINIVAAGEVVIDGAGGRATETGVFAGNPIASGRAKSARAGDVNVLGRNVMVSSASLSSASVSGTAGSVSVRALDGSIVLNGKGEITVNSSASSAGAVRLAAKGGDVVVDAASKVSATAQLDGGNVDLTGRFIIIRGNSLLLANSSAGNGGVFTLDSLLFMRPGSSPPNVSSSTGQAGSVNVRNAVDIQSSLSRLPEGLLAGGSSIAYGCERGSAFASTLAFSSLEGGSGSLFEPSREGLHGLEE